MTTKQLYSKKQIKYKIIKDRLTHLFQENAKEIAKILAHLIDKNKEKNNV